MGGGTPQTGLGTPLSGRGTLIRWCPPKLLELCSVPVIVGKGQEERCSPMAARDLKVYDDELERLRDKFPAWYIWMSQARRLWATRKGQIAPSRNRDSRWSMAIDAGTTEDLEKQLEEQKLLG